MNNLLALYKKCKKSDSSFIYAFINYIYVKLFYGKDLLIHQKVIIKGIRNIEVKDRLEVGLNYIGFIHKTDKTYLNIRGKLQISGKHSFGRGCRIDIGPNAIVKIGDGGYINCNTNIIIMHSLTIGDDCSISWDCQFLDDDLHQFSYPDKKDTENAILIGNHVWIGCGVKIYKGTIIPDGCIIAANSIVKGIFTTPNTLIGGFPAKQLKENTTWK